MAKKKKKKKNPQKTPTNYQIDFGIWYQKNNQKDMTHSKGENQSTKYDTINKIGKDIKTLL